MERTSRGLLRPEDRTRLHASVHLAAASEPRLDGRADSPPWLALGVPGCLPGQLADLEEIASGGLSRAASVRAWWPYLLHFRRLTE